MRAVKVKKRATRRRLAVALVALALLVHGWGCAHLRNAAAGSLIEDVATATSRHDDVALVSQAIPTYLLLLEGLVEGSPDDLKLRLAAAQMYVGYATLVEAEDPERASRLYGRAKRHGLRALATKRKIAPLLAAPFEEFSHIVEELDSGDLELVFWVASSWGAWISTNLNSMAALADLPRVILLMEWIIGQDEGYQDGGPHIFLGIYHAALSPSFGGNLDKSLNHFQRALALSEEKSLMVFVQMARFYARRVFDRELYVSLLNRALESPVDGNPGLILQNAVAKRMARRLLGQVDEFF